MDVHDESAIEAMVTAYIACALWSSYDSYHDGGRPLDASKSGEDIAPDTLAAFETDCRAFALACADDLAEVDAGQAGHDLWLTRNGHGAGFWDRGLGERGERLSAAARAYGDVDLYVGDDGQVHA